MLSYPRNKGKCIYYTECIVSIYTESWTTYTHGRNTLFHSVHEKAYCIT